MRNAHGLLIYTDASGAVQQIDTYRCGHCGLPVPVTPKQNAADVGGFCRVCMENVCPRCCGTGLCDPFESKIEARERRAHELKAWGLAD